MGLGRFLAIAFVVIGFLALLVGREEETTTDAAAVPVAAPAEEEAPPPDPPADKDPEMMEPKTMTPAPAAPPAPAQEPEPQEVVFRVTGDPGLPFQGSIATTGSSESVQGTTPQDFPLEVDAGLFSSDIVSANAQNMAGAGYLEVQVVVNGAVEKEANTSAQYGLAQVTWMPGK